MSARLKLPLTLALCAAAMLRPAESQTPRDIVARAVAAMGGGGESALRALPGVTVQFHSMTFALGQEETPRSPARAVVAYGTTTTDWTKGRRTQTLEIRQVTGTIVRQRRVTAGGIGLLETNGQPAPDGPGAVVGVERAMRLVPERLLLAALDRPTALTALPAKTWRGEPSDGVRYADGPDTLDLYFDRRSGLLTVTEQLADDGVLGDRRTVTWYTRWQPAGGVFFARQVDVEVNGRLQTHSVATAVTVGAAADSLFAIPDSIAARAQRPALTPPPPTVTLAELAPGVWRAEGGSHHSLVVDQGAHLVVVEAPQTSARMQAVLDTLRSRFPGKPVGLVVNTHHHWDHSGGVRAALAAGLPVVTHGRNVAFVRDIAAARKTVAPDALSQRPRAPTVTEVDDSLTLGTGDARVVVYRVPTAHVEGMLAAYVPAARLLFTSDVLTPGPTLAPLGSAELVVFARARGLTIERVAGGQGGVANWADVERAATPGP